MKTNPSFIMIPRKLVITAITVVAVLFIGIVASFQYTNYVSRQICGVVTISNDAYKLHPPPSDTGKQLATAMEKLEKKYSCR